MHRGNARQRYAKSCSMRARARGWHGRKTHESDTLQCTIIQNHPWYAQIANDSAQYLYGCAQCIELHGSGTANCPRPMNLLRLEQKTQLW